MISVMKNDWLRTKNNFASTSVMFALILGVIVASFVLAGRTSNFATIAILKEDSAKITSPELNIIQVKEKPLNSELVKGTYDAFVKQEGTNHFAIETIKGSDFKNQLMDILEKQKSKREDNKQKENTGTLLLSYLLMFLLMASLTNMKLFSEDKEKKMFERIVTTPVSYFKVLLGHSFFSFLLIFLPTIVFIFTINLVFKNDLGLSYVQLSFLLLLICTFATTLALFITAIFKEGDKANMFGSLFIIITTILSGSFFSFEGGNRWLAKIIQFLPQKRFLLLFKEVEASQHVQTLLPNLIYILVFTLLFFVLAIRVTKKNYQLK